jgi:hypothetical protein
MTEATGTPRAPPPFDITASTHVKVVTGAETEKPQELEAVIRRLVGDPSKGVGVAVTKDSPSCGIFGTKR